MSVASAVMARINRTLVLTLLIAASSIFLLFQIYNYRLYSTKVKINIYMKSSDAKASKCHLKFSSRMIIFIKLVYLSSVISLKWQ